MLRAERGWGKKEKGQLMIWVARGKRVRVLTSQKRMSPRGRVDYIRSEAK
jgi:hypothetical protein